jgi:hypothetical protein
MNVDKDYHFASVKELEDPLKTGIQKGVNMRVAAGDYSLIIADAQTGNFPAVAFWQAINRRYQELYYPAIPGVFLKPPVRSRGYKPLNDQLTEQLPNNLDIPNRALIVTEYIDTGSHCEIINEAMSKRNIIVDALSVMAKDPAEIYEDESIVTGNIYIGGLSKKCPKLRHVEELKNLPWQFNNQALLKIPDTIYRRYAYEDMMHLSETLYQSLL